MIGWLNLTIEQRRAVIDEAEQLSGITAKAIEKDWWVTLTLKALFQSAYKDFMIFKGGTSLSKGWKLISRFSEDIDIALDPQAFGMEYIENPAKNYIDKLKKKGCNFTSNQLLNELKVQFRALGLADGTVTIEAAEIPATRPDTDPQSLFVKYSSLYQPSEYIADDVKVEVSVRSMKFPFTSVSLQSILYEVNHRPIYAEVPFVVQVVEPRKTFIEKVLLLHEEFGKADRTKVRIERMSRHLYDIYKMMDTDIETQALNDNELYNHLIKHREKYMRIPWVNYESLKRETISFLPPNEVFDLYKSDYKTMQEEMIYEKAASFDEVIEKLQQLQESFRGKVKKQ